MHSVSAPTPPRPSRAQLRRGFIAPAFDDPSMERYRTPAAWRWISVLSGLLSLILVTAPVLVFVWQQEDPSRPDWAFLVAAVVLLVPWVFTTGMLNGSVSGIFDLKTVQLDEIEQRDRDAAYRSAYRTLIPLNIVALGAVAGLALEGSGVWVVWSLGMALLVQLLLPQHIAAWRFAARDDSTRETPAAPQHGA